MTQVAINPPDRRRPLDRASLLSGLGLALLINGGGLGALVYVSRHPSERHGPQNEVYVDVKLMKFGKKRDLSFLPHKDAARAPDPTKIKVTDNPDKPVPKDKPKEPPKPDLSKLDKALKDLKVEEDRKGAVEEGDPNGVQGGTSTDPSGDPFLQEIVAAVQSKWTVPTMLSPGELARLQADACLKIDDEGRLVEFRIKGPSGNNLFDGSLLSALSTIKDLPKPHGPFARAARRGNLCPTFSKQ